jgi:hypothetical protein
MAANDKQSVQEMWKEPPQVDFPVVLFSKMINI